MKVRIIGMRYGSLEDFSEVRYEYRTIAHMTHVPYTTVCTVLRNFVRRGKQIDLYQEPQRSRSYKCIPEQVQ